jgi:predicted O-methyltransferase YrrM
MALALPDDGLLITCDSNPEWTHHALAFWQQAGVLNQISQRLQPALESLHELLASGHGQSFDFIFIDADKTNYCQYYELALQLIKPTGLIAIDNIFWRGEVLNLANTRGQTRAIRKLNTQILQDTRVHISLLPLGDGLFLIQPSPLCDNAGMELN